MGKNSQVLLKKKNKIFGFIIYQYYYKFTVIKTELYWHAAATAAAKSLQSCPTLCNPIDGSPPGSAVPGILQQEHWSGLPFPSPIRESEVAQSCLTPSDPMYCSLAGSSIHGIFQARVLEWGAINISIHSLI